MLKASSDFQRVGKLGRRWHSAAFILQILRKESADPFRFGLTASRKVGNAVTRNRAKRRLREIIRAFPLPLPAGVDMVLIAKTAAAQRDFSLMKEDFLKGMKEMGMLA
jgi:ribonuclease P protein component